MTVDTSFLTVLTLIDLSLAANRLLIVLFSGYESFVSKLDIGETTDRPEWMGTVDIGGPKPKLIASIVAISGIHLLKRVLEIGKGGEGFGDFELRWLIVIHVVSAVFGVLMVAMDWMVAKTRPRRPEDLCRRPSAAASAGATGFVLRPRLHSLSTISSFTRWIVIRLAWSNASPVWVANATGGTGARPWRFA